MGFSPFGRAGTRPSELRFRLGKSLTLQLPFCRAGFYTLPMNFLSARCETAPYIKPIFLCRAGFYTLPTNSPSARCKTVPYTIR